MESIPVTGFAKNTNMAKSAKPLGPVKRINGNKFFGNRKRRDIEKEIKEKLMERLTYNKVYKNSQSAGVMVQYEADPKLHYFNQCVYVDKELFLPVLEYV